MIRLLGIDPGISGALAVLDGDGAALEWCDMPTIKVGKRTVVDAAGVVDWLRSWRKVDDVVIATVEQLGAIRNTGRGKDASVITQFSLGRSMGVIEGVLVAESISANYVMPVVWKRHHGLIGMDKDASRGVASRLFPDVPLTRKKDHNQADALLLAVYGLRHFAAAA